VAVEGRAAGDGELPAAALALEQAASAELIAGNAAEWENEVDGMLKAEIKWRNMTYEQVAEKLAEIGVQNSARDIINKINRGSFSAVFFVQCPKEIGCRELKID
jgi:hypothetical protein